MAATDRITMSMRELDRFKVIQGVADACLIFRIHGEVRGVHHPYTSLVRYEEFAAAAQLRPIRCLSHPIPSFIRALCGLTTLRGSDYSADLARARVSASLHAVAGPIRVATARGAAPVEHLRYDQRLDRLKQGEFAVSHTGR